MGHKVVAGFITKSEMLGKPMLRVDVPATSAYPAFTQLYGEAAIYCVTFTSEDVACRTAESTKLNPVSVYVPDLITKEKYEEAQDRFRETIDRYQAQIEALRRGLPAPQQDGNSAEVMRLRGSMERIRAIVGRWLSESDAPPTEEIVHVMDELEAFGSED
jgi:hypothetical protein